MRQASELLGSRRSAVFLAAAVVTGVFTYLAVRDLHVRDVAASLSARSYGLLVPSVAVLAGAIAMRGVRWWVLFAPVSRPPFRVVLSSLLIGYLFNNILPARAGEVARVVALHQRARTSRVEAGATVVLERLYDVAALLVLLAVTLPFTPDVAWLPSGAVIGTALAVFVGLAVALVAGGGEGGRRLVTAGLARIPAVSPARAHTVAAGIESGLVGLRKPRLALVVFLLSLISWAAFGLSAWFVIHVFDLGLSPVAGLFVMIAVGLAMILPSPPAGLGVFEGAVVLALGVYGVQPADALSCALVLHAVNFFPFIVAGVVVTVSHGRTVRRFRTTHRASLDSGTEL